MVIRWHDLRSNVVDLTPSVLDEILRFLTFEFFCIFMVHMASMLVESSGVWLVQIHKPEDIFSGLDFG